MARICSRARLPRDGPAKLPPAGAGQHPEIGEGHFGHQLGDPGDGSGLLLPATSGVRCQRTGPAGQDPAAPVTLAVHKNEIHAPQPFALRGLRC